MTDTTALADRLAAARLAGTVLADVPALDLATGLAVQALAAPRLAAGWGPQIGWKLGATSAGAMAFLNVGAPIRGRVFRAFPPGPVPTLPGGVVEAEPEVLLVLGDDRRPVRAHLGVELNRPALAEPFALGAGAIVADNAAHLALLVGPELPLAALDHPEAVAAALAAGGAATEGRADAVLGNPLAALAAQLDGDRRGLRPGDIIATGAMARAIPWPAGAVLRLSGSAGVAEWTRPA